MLNFHHFLPRASNAGALFHSFAPQELTSSALFTSKVKVRKMVTTMPCSAAGITTFTLRRLISVYAC
jgi:hypothetical protein